MLVNHYTYDIPIVVRLWKDVTDALKQGDLDAATAAKHKVSICYFFALYKYTDFIS